MGRYAQDTSVSSERSRAEIESTLARYGARDFGYMTTGGGRYAMVAFAAQGRQVRFELEMPDPKSDEFTKSPTGRKHRDETAAYKAWEQACRQRWRALSLVIKAKLEAVECGISTFESEFLANIVLPGGQTVGKWAKPQLEAIYSTRGAKQMPLLPGAK